MNLGLPLTWHSVTLDSHSYHVLVSDLPFLVVKAIRGLKYKIDPCATTLTDTTRWHTTLTFAMPDKPSWGDWYEYAVLLTVLTKVTDTDLITVNGVQPNVKWTEVRVLREANSELLSSVP